LALTSIPAHKPIILFRDNFPRLFKLLLSKIFLYLYHILDNLWLRKF